MTHPGGRPPIYSDPEELQRAVDLYFIQCDDPDKPQPKTITGLALALGFCSRGTIYEYEQKPEFSDIIKKAMLNVECSYEQRACTNNPTGPIFVLKNMGWSDKQEIDNTHHFPDKISINFTDSSKDE